MIMLSSMAGRVSKERAITCFYTKLMSERKLTMIQIQDIWNKLFNCSGLYVWLLVLYFSLFSEVIIDYTFRSIAGKYRLVVNHYLAGMKDPINVAEEHTWLPTQIGRDGGRGLCSKIMVFFMHNVYWYYKYSPLDNCITKLCTLFNKIFELKNINTSLRYTYILMRVSSISRDGFWILYFRQIFNKISI